MKKYYTMFTLAILAIALLQTFYFVGIYENFILVEKQYIKERVYQTIDIELTRRMHGQNAVSVSYTNQDKMTQTQRDSLFKHNPPPTAPPPLYNYVELMDKGVIRSSADITNHISQDRCLAKGLPLNIHMFDSLYNSRVERNYQYKLSRVDSTGQIIESLGDDNDFNYSLEPIQIGMKGNQFLKMETQITLSEFIKQSIFVVSLSLLIIMMPLASLIFLLTSVRRKKEQLLLREQSINGIIHDLKSPLANISTMLNWFKISETDPNKQGVITISILRISHLSRKVESLLEVARYDKKQIVICTEGVEINELTKRAKTVIDALKLNFANKQCTVILEQNAPANQIVYVDINHYDTIVTNLVENALKYSNQEVNIYFTIAITNDNMLNIEVKDDGFGIENKYLKKIFKQHFRVPQTSNKIKGHGIGLGYLRAVALAHGGSIDVRSVLGEGSKFSIKIKCQKVDYEK